MDFYARALLIYETYYFVSDSRTDRQWTEDELYTDHVALTIAAEEPISVHQGVCYDSETGAVYECTAENTSDAQVALTSYLAKIKNLAENYVYMLMDGTLSSDYTIEDAANDYLAEFKEAVENG